MPRGDGTGPTGAGAMTGRGRNNCGRISNNVMPAFGRGFGRGYGLSNNQIVDSQESLVQEKQDLENRIKEIDTKLAK